MKSYKRNKKTSNKTKKKHSVRLVKLDAKGTTLVIFKKNTRKSVLNKVFKNINKSDYIDLCKEMKYKKKMTIGKRGKNKRRAYSKKNIKGGGTVMGPIGTLAKGGNFLKIFFGNELFFLLGGASIATLMYAFKKAKLIPESSGMDDDDIDYIAEKLVKAEECKETISNLSNKKMKEPWTRSNILCIKNRRRKGTTSQREEMWVDYELEEEEKERQRLKEEEIQMKKVEAEAEKAALTAVSLGLARQ